MMMTNRQLLMGALLLTLFSFLALASLVVRDHRMKVRLEILEERTSQSMNEEIQAAGRQAEANRERLEELSDRLSQMEPMNDLVRGMSATMAAHAETVQELNRLLGEYRSLIESMENGKEPLGESDVTETSDSGAENGGDESIKESGLEKEGGQPGDVGTKVLESDPGWEWMPAPLIFEPMETP